MNTPNKLTLARVLMIPILLLLLYIDFPLHMYCALLVFILASITDAIDGRLARSRGEVTDFGKFMDRWRTSCWSWRQCSGLWKAVRCRPGSCSS